MKRTQWTAFVKKGRLAVRAAEFGEVVGFLGRFLLPPTKALTAGETFGMAWAAGGPWE